jgi:LIVCS family branched-chain amino acid:cation transporter
LLGAIALITFYGFYVGLMQPTAPTVGWDALANGFFQGYQTMDLLAAFFFSQFVINHLYTRTTSGTAIENNDSSIRSIFYKASWIGGSILSSVYIALVLLGWLYSPLLVDKPPQEMLGIIATASLGSWAAPIVCLAVVSACLTTAVVLTSLFADFLRTEVTQNKIGNSLAIVVTLLIGFSVSTLEFGGIAQFLGPILEAIYPALILLTFVKIGQQFFTNGLPRPSLNRQED